jgi:hypothetical protein
MAPNNGICTANCTEKMVLPLNMLMAPKHGICTANGIVKMVLNMLVAQWYLHDKLHREDGAAYEGADGTKEWWLHDWHFENAETWAEALLKSRNEKHDKQSIDAFLKAILKKDIEEAL